MGYVIDVTCACRVKGDGGYPSKVGRFEHMHPGTDAEFWMPNTIGPGPQSRMSRRQNWTRTVDGNPEDMHALGDFVMGNGPRPSGPFKAKFRGRCEACDFDWQRDIAVLSPYLDRLEAARESSIDLRALARIVG